jgi:hypothetical protein
MGNGSEFAAAAPSPESPTCPLAVRGGIRRAQTWDAPCDVASLELIAVQGTSSALQIRRLDRGLRLRVRIRQRVLDREIAAGLRTDADAARALRAQQLTSAPERRRVAASIARILETADERHAEPAANLTVVDAQVLAARHGLVVLVDALRGEGAVSARGVALARQLIDSVGSPLLRAQSGLTVQLAVSETIAAL